MKWTVVWKPGPQNDLASLWTDASPEDRQAITAAANAIDDQLRIDPQTAGESRPRQRRILFQPPLTVIFEVHEQDRLVEVVKVWRVPGRP